MYTKKNEHYRRTLTKLERGVLQTLLDFHEEAWTHYMEADCTKIGSLLEEREAWKRTEKLLMDATQLIGAMPPDDCNDTCRSAAAWLTHGCHQIKPTNPYDPKPNNQKEN